MPPWRIAESVHTDLAMLKRRVATLEEEKAGMVSHERLATDVRFLERKVMNRDPSPGASGAEESAMPIYPPDYGLARGIARLTEQVKDLQQENCKLQGGLDDLWSHFSWVASPDRPWECSAWR